MKNTVLAAIAAGCLCIGTNGNAQKAQTFTMSSAGSFANGELRNLLNFMELDYYKVAISGSGLKGKNYRIVSKEIWNGKVKKTDTIFNSKDNAVFKVATDTLSFSVFAGKTDKKNLKVRFSFERFGLVRNYKSTASKEYSLRDFGSHQVIETGKPFYAFVYILPTEHEDGSSSWCEVEADGNSVEDWGNKFGLKHYLLFEMCFD